MKVKGRIRLSPICPGFVRLRARTEVSLIVSGLIGGVGGLVLMAYCLECSPHSFENDQDESIEVLWARSDVGVFCYTRELM